MEKRQIKQTLTLEAFEDTLIGVYGGTLIKKEINCTELKRKMIVYFQHDHHVGSWNFNGECWYYEKTIQS